jgi:hypothetical protein
VLSAAWDEISTAAAWFDEQRQGLGSEFWRLVDATLVEVQSSPRRFSKSEFAAEDFESRFALVTKFHYVIHFVIESDEVIVAAVAHGARRPGYWLRRVRK